MNSTFSSESAANKDPKSSKTRCRRQTPAKLTRTYVKFSINQIQSVSSDDSAPSKPVKGVVDPISHQMRRPKIDKSANDDE